MISYNPHNWFWIVGGDESRAWSSEAGAYVETWPDDKVTRILSEQELGEVLNVYGLQGPVPFVPKTVSPYQARVALYSAGLLDDVQAAIASADMPARIAWEYATVFERNSPFIEALAPMLGLTEQQVDDLFVAASNI